MRNPFSLRIVNEDLIFNGPGFVSLWGRDNTMSGEPRGGYIRFLRSGVEWHFAVQRGHPMFKRTGGRPWMEHWADWMRPKGDNG